MTKIEEIVKVLDEELIRLNKPFLSLSQANKILLGRQIISEDDIKKKTLKHLLEEKIIKNGHQTIHEPKQWRIVHSFSSIPPSNMEKNSDEDDNESENEIQANNIFCPLCGGSVNVPDEIINEKRLVCPYCKMEFSNPLEPIKRKEIIHKVVDNGSSDKSAQKIVIGLVVLIIAIVIGIKYLSESKDEEKPNSSFIITPSEENSPNDKAIGRERSRKSFESNVLQNQDNTSSGSSNQSNINGEKEIFTFQSEFYDIEKPGESGYDTKNESTFHKFDLFNMTVTQKSPLNGKYVKFTYPIQSVYRENRSGYIIIVLVINSLGVKEIWFSPTVGNLGYDYIDGTRIACYNVTRTN